MPAIHAKLLGLMNKISTAIGNDALDDARTLMCECIGEIDNTLGGPSTQIADPPASMKQKKTPRRG